MPSIRSKLLIALVRNRHIFRFKLRPEVIDERFSVQDFRDKIENASKRYMKIPEDIITKKVDIDGINGEWIIPSSAPEDKVVLYIHGGGFISGSCESHRIHMINLVKRTGVKVLLFDYRLAPEHQYPAALDDCICAYKWLMNQGYNADDIVVAGESAGGGLTLSTIITLRDRGIMLPKAVVAISACTDLSCTSESLDTNAKRDIAPMNSWNIWTKFYVGDNDPTSPYLSPLYDKLDGLVPMQLYVGTYEIYLDEMTKFAKKAEKAGNDVELKIYDGMVHGFPFLPLAEGKKALDEIAGFICKKLID